MGVCINGDTPNSWMVYTEKSENRMDDVTKKKWEYGWFTPCWRFIESISGDDWGMVDDCFNHIS